MKILNFITEIITSPFSILLRGCNGKNHLQNFAKVSWILFISLIIVVGLVLYFYRNFIFK